ARGSPAANSGPDTEVGKGPCRRIGAAAGFAPGDSPQCGHCGHKSLKLGPIVTKVLSSLMLLLLASWPIAAQDAKPLTAILLIARAELPDPNFGDSVVLVMNNLGPAPIGIIINRPTQIPVARLFPDLGRLTDLHDRIYFGGPVDFGTVWFLFRAAKPP